MAGASNWRVLLRKPLNRGRTESLRAHLHEEQGNLGHVAGLVPANINMYVPVPGVDGHLRNNLQVGDIGAFVLDNIDSAVLSLGKLLLGQLVVQVPLGSLSG